MTVEVLITGALHESALKMFQSNPDLKITYKPDCDRKELLALVSKAQVLVSRSETDVDRDVIEKAPELKIIARAAVGVGNIDLDFATEKGILVINCPGKNTNSAAELTIAHILSMLRKVSNSHVHLKNGGWDRHRFTGRELRGKRIGIVGLGNVGHRVAKFARGFDMEVFAYDPYISPEVFARNGAVCVNSLQELAAGVDILTVHVPLNKETKGMVHAGILKLMPKGSYFVNAARGGVALEKDLLDSLNTGHLAGVALDTFQSEPSPLPELIKHEHVWCTPHIGASTEEAQIEIGKTVYQQVCKALEGGVVDYPVNLPGVGTPDNPLLKAYSVLAEKLGSTIGQILDFNPLQMEISYRGNLAGLDTALIKLSLMKGYAGHVVNGLVSFVNAGAHFEKLGIKVRESDDAKFDSYKSALKIVVTGQGEHKLSIGGIVFDDKIIRISLLNDFYFELDPVGSIIMMENHDRPGVIGDVGQCLSKQGINIDTFALSRNKRGGKAMSLIRIDGELTQSQLQELRALKNMVSVKALSL
jgi:D-3-phosphoglycerate dehydrogenase